MWANMSSRCRVRSKPGQRAHDHPTTTRQEFDMILSVVGDTVISRPLRPRPEGLARPGDSALGLLDGADLTIGNLEVALTARGVPAEKPVAMRAPQSGAAELARLGFDALSLATNHALDWGIDGMRDTIAALDDAGIRHAGAGEDVAQAASASYVSAASGEQVALLSFCSALPPNFNATNERPGIAPIRVRQTFEYDGVILEEQPGTPPFVHSWAHEPDVIRAVEAIRAAKAREVPVVVALHWGVPWCYLPSTQGPLAQYQRPLAHRLVEAGADLIIGHHSHCLHPVEAYRNSLILYSTGNFVFHHQVDITGDGGRPTPPVNPVLVDGPWYDSAIFDVTLGGPVPRLRVRPIVLDENNEPTIPTEERSAAILGELERSSRALSRSARFTAAGEFVSDEPGS
ncbi:MAG: CapA family protein [Comamonadaceae bacterium]|nr:MAG: CapA family protein [Comamonadaceae bacterium]